MKNAHLVTKNAITSCLVILTLTACASFSEKPVKVIMQNPETMEFADCKVDIWGTGKSYDKNNECVEDYKKKGWVVWGEY